MISNRLQVKSVTLSPLLPPSRCYIRQKPISSSWPLPAVVPTTPSHLIHRRATPSGTISTDKLSHTLLCVSLHTQCQRVLSQTDEIREIMIIRHLLLFLGNCCCTGGSCTCTVGGVCLPKNLCFPSSTIYLSPFLSFLNNSILVEFVSDVESAAATGSRPSSHYSQAALNPQSCRCKIS